MRATSLVGQLLKFPRLTIVSVRLEERGLVVGVAPRGRSRCSGCGRKRPGYDRLPVRTWRHLDFGGWQILLEASLARVECPSCGIVVEQVSFADPRSRFTKTFEDLVGWMALKCDKTMIANYMRVTWRTVGSIVERVVERHRGPIDYQNLTAISVDELSYRKGHRYITVVTDLRRGRVIWTKEGKSADTLAAFFKEIGPECCARIRHVAMDMSGGYIKAVQEELPAAEIVFDRFHVMQLLSAAVDTVRRQEWRQSEKGSEASSIKGTRYLLLHRPWNITPEEDAALSSLFKKNKRLCRAYLLKESFAGIYDGLFQPGWARRRLNEWISWARRSRLPPFVKVARTIQGYLEGILGFFKTGFTTGLSEGLNNKARLATRQAYGFHSADAVRAMIELRCSGLQVTLPQFP